MHFRHFVSTIVVACLVIPSTGLADVRTSDSIDGVPYTQAGINLPVMPDVEMESGILVTEDGRVLWSRSPDDKRAIASITKIMTAVVALDSASVTETVTIPKASSRVGESTAFLRSGERISLLDLLDALLVKSGNDAAVAVARYISDDEESFVELMNEKALELGLKNTHFANPHGLDEDGNHSSAADLSVLARYAMRDPVFRSIVGQKYASIEVNGRTEKLENTNILIENYAGANGVKTGWTDRAGYCVIDSARRGDVELYAVVLGADDELQRFRDAKGLLDFGFAHFRPQKLASAGSVIGAAPISDYLDESVSAAVSENTTVPVFDLAGPITRDVRIDTIDAPVEKGQRVGVATFTQGDKVIATVPLVAVEDVARPGLLERIWIGTVRFWRWITG